ncbi:MAG: cation:proton antiporter [Planctomycetota bacterium]|jgi:CPA1 family monovalent cation:H+ antiporter
MEMLDLCALLLSMAAIFSYINFRFIKLPTTIGIMLIAMLISVSLVILGHCGFEGIQNRATAVLEGVDFNKALMHGMLSFLLFSGALHVNLEDLARHKWIISILATFGVVISTFIVGGSAWIGILKKAGVPKSLETKITGESLFNDGVAVVVFLVIMGIVAGGHDVTAGHIILLFIEEAIGGIFFGFAIGWLAYLMLKSVNNYQVEVLLTLALVMGGYSLAYTIHVSGPIAMVVAGIFIGNRGRLFAMSEKTREHLDSFWELMDEILNAVLFLLIGLEVLVIATKGSYLIAGLAMIPVVLLARFISVGLPVTFMRRIRDFSPDAVKIMTWGGLRGGISVALALSIPSGSEREALLTVTYIIVVFSILVQGLTIGRLVASKKLTE